MVQQDPIALVKGFDSCSFPEFGDTEQKSSFENILRFDRTLATSVSLWQEPATVINFFCNYFSKF